MTPCSSPFIVNFEHVITGWEDEMTNAVAEALSMLSPWNPQWQFCCFMIDNRDEEVSAIKQKFQYKDVNVALQKRG